MTADSTSDPTIGRTLVDRYRIDAQIARGGMARVYRARDARLDRDVAIKILSDPYASDPAFTDRSLAEARAAASLSHPSLVHVYDSGSDGDAHFIVMELLDRHRSLREALDADGPLRRDAVLSLGRELLAGLRVVHDRGLVHCDVKSGNVMLGAGRPAKLIDFGIARSPADVTDGDTSIGSLQFMSPEQLHGEALTPASDLFSLGVVLYEALTGRMPYAGRTPEEVSAAHVDEAVRPPSAFVEGVPGRLDDAILQALRREPAQRFHTAEAMARALQEADDDAVPERDADETRVISIPQRAAEPAPARRGYVPPPAPPPAAAPVAPHPPARRHSPARSPNRAGMLRGLGTLLILGAAALVAALVILPLLNLEFGGGGGGADGSPLASPSGAPQPSAEPGTVLIPQTVGLPTADAIQLARDAGLNWRVECAENPEEPEGIIRQEPPADTSVAPGSRFIMFSARISDCT